jgi:hypothetical protein
MEKLSFPVNRNYCDTQHFLLAHAKLNSAYPRGTFYKTIKPMRAYKRVQCDDDRAAIAVLDIPTGAEFYADHSDGSWYGNKMRASVGVVVSIHAYIPHDYWHPSWLAFGASPREWHDTSLLPPNFDSSCFVDVQRAHSMRDIRFEYVVGQEVVADYFCENDKQCAGGIHFFLNVREALAYR